jgi:hypothetical protein
MAVALGETFGGKCDVNGLGRKTLLQHLALNGLLGIA